MNRIVVASKNPTKLQATKAGFEAVFPTQSFSFEGIEVSSGVSHQPMSDEETYQGALQRAQAAQTSALEADFWVGMEGGVMPRYGSLEAFAWIVILSSKGKGFARTASFILPPPIADLVYQGIELGLADDQFFGRSDSKKKNGAVGILTQDLITRSQYYSHAVILALVPFMNEGIYFE